MVQPKNVATKTPGYSPRWLYAFLNWIRRTPLGGWLLGIVWMVGLAVLYHWRAWQLGLLPQGEFHNYLLGMGYWSAFSVFMLLSLDRIAETNLREFGYLAGKNEKEIQLETYNFISVPEKTALVVMGVGLLLNGPYSYQAYPVSFPGLFTIYPILTISILVLIQSALSAYFFYRNYRQLQMVRQLYRKLPKVSLFNLSPIYALSRYTSWIAIFLILFMAGGYIVGATPEALNSFLILLALVSLVAFLLFLLPLLEIRQRLIKEKARMVNEHNLQLELINTKVKQAVVQNKLAKLGELRTAASTVKEQLEFVQKVPTWPWNPGTLRNLLIPILLPLFLAIMQRYVLTWLGF